MRTRAVLSATLLLVSLVSLYSIHGASGQQFTGSTSFLVTISSASLTLTQYLSQANSVTLVTGTLTAAASAFENVGSCQIGVGPLFDANGLTHVAYSASAPMMLYVLDQGTLMAWGSSMFGGGCEPPIGNSVPYKLGSTYPLAGSFDVNLSTGSYGVVLVAPTSEVNPTAIVAVSPVAYTESVATANATTSSVGSCRPSCFSTLPFNGTAVNTQITVTTTNPPAQNYLDWIAAVILVVLVILAFSLVLWTRRKQGPRSPS